MAKHSKKFNELKSSLDQEKLYPIKEALEIVKEKAFAKFDETVEIHFRLGINAKKGDQQVRGTVVLPHTFGESKKVAAFVPFEKEKEAKEAGADVVYTEDNIKELQKSGKINFDIAVATPDMIRTVAPLARFLGPKGLMPSPKNETITTNLKKTIEELKKGKVAFKNDDTANLHQSLGKVSTEIEKLLENFDAIKEAVAKSKPDGSKGVFVRAITVCSTMGASVKVEL